MYDERHIEQTDLNRNLNSHTFSFDSFSFALLSDIQRATAFVCAIEEWAQQALYNVWQESSFFWVERLFVTSYETNDWIMFWGFFLIHLT